MHRESNTRYRAKPGKSYGTEEIMDILFIVVTWKKKRVEAFLTSICSFQQTDNKKNTPSQAGDKYTLTRLITV